MHVQTESDSPAPYNECKFTQQAWPGNIVNHGSDRWIEPFERDLLCYICLSAMHSESITCIR